MSLSITSPGFALQPSANRVPTSTNYITDFNFLNQYLPDTYEKEFERYGNRTLSAFLRMVGAEMPSNSDLIKWAEQGRLHIKYTNVNANSAAAADNATFLVNDVLVPTNQPLTGTASQIAARVGQTVVVTDNASAAQNKAIITAVDYAAGTFTVGFYEATGQAMAQNATCTVFIYGSEFGKGTNGMIESVEPSDTILDNKPIILKDKYIVSGSDMAQIGWIEVTTENGATGYLWYLKAEHETRLRFDDYLETAMIEAVPADAASGAADYLQGVGAAAGVAGKSGSEGVFHAVETRGNVAAGSLVNLSDVDNIIKVLDNEGAIEENVIFVNRALSFDIDDMLAKQNSYGAGGTSYGLFDNDEEMALNLGFTGFRRGYDFYKSDWKYLNDPTMRGNLPTAALSIEGLLVPAGSTNVYDQVLGKNAKRPFLHVRYRASETEDRRYKTWATGSAGGARTSDLDAMEINFLSERCCCVMGANNFVLFTS